MFGLTTEKKAIDRAACAFLAGVKMGLGAVLVIAALLLLCLPSEAQFTWPTYPINSKVDIYKVLKDNGSGVAVLATNDGTNFLGVNQNSVSTSHGNVQIQTSGPSQVLVGATPVTMGIFVTADANSNVVPFAPALDGNLHCSLGTVIGLGMGAGAAGTYVYVNIDSTCSRTSNVTGLVTSFNGRTGAVVPLAGDFTCAMVTGCVVLNFADNETPATFSTNTAYTLANVANPTASVMLFVNGSLLVQGVDWTFGSPAGQRINISATVVVVTIKAFYRF